MTMNDERWVIMQQKDNANKNPEPAGDGESRVDYFGRRSMAWALMRLS